MDERLTYRAELETDFKTAVEQCGLLEEDKNWQKRLEAAYKDNSALYRILNKLAKQQFPELAYLNRNQDLSGQTGVGFAS